MAQLRWTINSNGVLGTKRAKIKTRTTFWQHWIKQSSRNQLILRYPPPHLHPRKQQFFHKRFMAARREEGCYEKRDILHVCFLVCKGLSNHGDRVARGSVFQEIRPGAGFKTGVFFKKSVGGGVTVGRVNLAPILVKTCCRHRSRCADRGIWFCSPLAGGGKEPHAER